MNTITKKELTEKITHPNGSETTLLRQLAALNEQTYIINQLSRNKELDQAIKEALQEPCPHPNRPNQIVCISGLVDSSRKDIPRALLPRDFRNAHFFKYLSSEDENRIIKLLSPGTRSEFKKLLTDYLLSDCAESLLFDYLKVSLCLAFYLLRNPDYFEVLMEIIAQYPRVIDLFTIQRLSQRDCHYNFKKSGLEYTDFDTILEGIVLLNHPSSKPFIRLLFKQSSAFVIQLKDMLLAPNHKAYCQKKWSLFSLFLQEIESIDNLAEYTTVYQDPRFSLTLLKSVNKDIPLFHKLCFTNTHCTLNLLRCLNGEFITDGFELADLMFPLPNSNTSHEFTFFNLLASDEHGYGILCFIAEHKITALRITPEAFLRTNKRDNVKKINSSFYELSKNKDSTLLSKLMKKNPDLLKAITLETLFETRVTRKGKEIPLIYNLVSSGSPYHLELLKEILAQTHIFSVIDFNVFFNHKHHCPLIIELASRDAGVELILKLVTLRPDMFNNMPAEVFFGLFDNKAFFAPLLSRENTLDLIEHILIYSKVIDKTGATNTKEFKKRAVEKQLSHDWVKKDKRINEVLSFSLASSINQTVFAPPSGPSTPKNQATPKQPQGKM